ncbi:hypothetical protein [Lacihabitans soyangensis]|uniref:Uncharacterized protein n=1 Tax=Lacihabitans soyangensis TaxID=869394 RepID=A0AAE3H4Q9_9BACT|nr:hypothetical protein [Lacihabitans soyangensis]MCP9763861.1 hypothetical protein [Lacihabitans soyangensis]
MTVLQTKPLSNIQAELLKLYANNLSDEDLFEIRMMLGKYFAKKATEAMDNVWDKNNLSEQDMINWTNEHNRI